MNSLVNIVLFGIVGAVMMAALLGLLLVAGDRAPRKGVRVAFGAVSVAVLLGVPASAALGELAAGAGYGTAFISALAVEIIIYAANIALLPTVMRRAGRSTADRPRPSAAVLFGGLAVSAVLALAASLLALALS
ncbi:hypothetical protein [Nocardiopsis suaedae]|uniref:DUF420 domain-containing protein n=1 Tax=Nocardiopsis suaedae TaxID=3018444 RepID=A0ABT4TTA4_9ACTN|nr:hypothetical protein [Nocardiopsis suaedae]MDA2807918.1 hypothetical protein [Nocardiopsis suaedae]